VVNTNDSIDSPEAINSPIRSWASGASSPLSYSQYHRIASSSLVTNKISHQQNTPGEKKCLDIPCAVQKSP